MSSTPPHKRMPRSTLTSIILIVFVAGLIIGGWYSYFSFKNQQGATTDPNVTRAFTYFIRSLWIGCAAFLVALLGMWRKWPFVFGGGCLFAVWFIPTALYMYTLALGVLLIIVWSYFYVRDNNISFMGDDTP
ncbi:hypothetical protein R6G85_04760 [Actinotignum urinale]|nr:hypothetical protein [Actinotignum urinale]MDY5151794.1 hypothetical protein [Actinotignum urinale]WIK58791.1 hypothetical protein CJ184_005935 [Actinotignum urinale]